MSIHFWPEIQTVTGGGNPGGGGTPTPIVRDSQWTIVAFEFADTSTQFVALPADAEVGDVVEIHPVFTGSGSPPSANVVAPSGELFATGSEVSGPGFIRKIESATWSKV